MASIDEALTEQEEWAAEWIACPAADGGSHTRLSACDDRTVFVVHEGGDGRGAFQASLCQRITPAQAREIGLAYLAVAMRAEAGEGR